MNSILCLTSLLISLQLGLCADTNYQYYTAGGIHSGLSADSNHFKLNGKEIVLFSGSLHYFRCPWQYWKDRLAKFRAAGLNTVQSYVAWNLHEEHEGQFNFDNGNLNLGAFLKQAKEEDLFVILRIGPFIAAELEMGGYPSWLANDPNMRLRSAYKGHLDKVAKYYDKVLPIVNEYQFSKGGPVIAVQYENEFGDASNKDAQEYFTFMRDHIVKSGFNGLLINCENGGSAPASVKHALKGTLITLNWADDPGQNGLQNYLNQLRQAQPNRPLFVTEFWSGWMDSWGGKHANRFATTYESDINTILYKGDSSINFYMFFGGTNFGFTNGGSVTTSYDYNAPISESGQLTSKYYKAKELFAKYVKDKKLPDLHIPNVPAVVPAEAYGVVKLKDYLSLDDILGQLQPTHVNGKPKHMEELGQAFGFILYRISAPKFKHLKLSGGVSDRAIVIIDEKNVGVVQGTKEYDLNTNDGEFSGKGPNHNLDILVENTGRDWDIHKAHKGLNGEVVLDNKAAASYSIYTLPFKEDFVQKLQSVKGRALGNVNGPAMFRAELEVKGSPRDTFIRLDNWTKGNVFINGINIGRYWNVGPQKTLYVPGPYLKTGKNDILMFELQGHANEVHFVDKPDFSGGH